MTVDDKSRARIVLSKNERLEAETASILPCRIQYTGKAPIPDFFQPTDLPDGTKEAYFRGRRLLGSQITIPQGYTGHLFDSSQAPQTKPVATFSANGRPRACDSGDEDMVAKLEEVADWKEKSRFDRLVVYGNSAPLDASQNVFTKGIDEWIKLASAIHGE